MSHLEQLGFFKAVACDNQSLIAGARILEIGSYDYNGGIRPLFESASAYTGVDLIEGPGVDVVASGHALDFPDGSFDITLSSECFEHDEHWRETFVNMVRMTAPGGLVAFSCASRGRTEHGTSRSEGGASPGTTGLGMQYYQNLSEDDFSGLGLDGLFSEYRFWYLPTHFDLYFAGVKRGQHIRAHMPNDLTIIRLKSLMPLSYRVLMAPFRGLSKVLPESKYQDIAVPMRRILYPAISRMEARRAVPGD